MAPLMDENEIQIAIVEIRKDQERASHESKQVRLEMERCMDAIRVLQDAQLLQPTETKQLIVATIKEVNSSKQVKFQTMAPYFTALLGFAAAMIMKFWGAA